jgi:pimeloyl-ACP methyl ester carboxylesterase
MRITLFVVSLCAIAEGASQIRERPALSASIYGNYRIGNDQMIGIDRFVTDDGQDAVLYSEYRSGVVRRLFKVADNEFEMGPGFNTQTPAELKIQVERDAKGGVTGVQLKPAAASDGKVAVRTAITETTIEITNGPVHLAGTLMVPDTKGPHPAIVLLHGSGPLTRYSFGPYPHFFTSLGFAVLVYDKRGTGDSTGTRLDSSTGAPDPLPKENFPDQLASDADAAIAFLRQRKDIDARRIGLWGSSEGGMLTTQVAAMDKRIAFAINSSGFMGPLYETTLYQAGLSLRKSGFTETQIAEVKAATVRWVDAARTGQGVEQVFKERDDALRENKGWLVGWTRLDINSAAQLRWLWDHVLSFSPLPSLADVKCPVLALYGELDTSTDAEKAAGNMRSVLSAAGHRDFTVKVIPNASHSLMEQPSGNRMAPGVFETLSTWLHDRMRTQ